MNQPNSSVDDGVTTYERMLKAGTPPCHKCIWFKGEVTVLCENHQHLADQVVSVGEGLEVDDSPTDNRVSED